MAKSKKGLLIAGIALLVVLLAVLAGLLFLLFRGDPSEPQKPESGDVEYTVRVKNASDVPLEGIGVYIYEDETQAELVWFDKTNADGEMFFKAPESDEYIAVLGNIPTGYSAEAYYPITGEETEIILYAGVLSDEDMQTVTYKLGDVMMDFTIIDTEGNEYTLSQLLKDKKAVVLNFWYLSCQPCRNEFPFMQEAYEQYKDDIEILAMNPVDMDEAAVAAFKEELGLTFPMAVVDELWAQMLQLTAYPTTVVIDRFGNISLIHKGSIDSADTFEQLFEYFAAEDYEQRAIQSIDEVVTKEEGSEENPMMQGGDQNFNITVGGGETYYLDLYKITGKVYLTVKGEDFTLTYNGKSYDSKNGSVTITITSEGPSTPVKLTIKNKTKEEQTYSVSLAAPKGSLSNPYSLKLGEFSINTETGNEQGVYGVYTAEKAGKLTVRCLSSSVSKYGFFLYNLRSYAMRNADEDATTDEDGYVTVSVQVKKGDQIQFNVAVARDSSNYIAAGNFKFELMLEDGTGEEEKKPEAEKATYTITVTDEEGNPLQGVTMNLKGSFTYVMPVEENTDPNAEPQTPETVDVAVDVNLTTDENGVVTTEQIVGPYTVTVRVPDGYKLEHTQYELTEEVLEAKVQMHKVVLKDYTVTVCAPNGEAVKDAIIILGGVVEFTDETGKTAFKLEEAEYTVVILNTPEQYVLKQETYTFEAGKTDLLVTLGEGPGSQENPIIINGETGFTTGKLTGTDVEYYKVDGVEGSTLTITGDTTTYVVINGGEKITPDEDGNILVPIQAGDCPFELAVGHSDTVTKGIPVQFAFPKGTVQNPAAVNIRRFSANIAEDNADGYYAEWTPTKNGKVELSLRATSATNCVITVTTGNTVLHMEGSGPLEIPIKKNQPVQIHSVAVPDANGDYPAIKVDFSGTITYDPDPVGTTYQVTVRDNYGASVADVTVQFVKDGTVAAEEITDSTGVAQAVLPDGDYTVVLTDKTLTYPETKVTATAPAVTLTVTRTEDPVPEGMTRYRVTITDYANEALSNMLIMLMKDGAPKGYQVVEGKAEAIAMDLPTDTYQVQVVFMGGQKYFVEDKDAVVTAEAPTVTLPAAPPLTADEESNWALGYVVQVGLGGTYVTLQENMETYFYFQPKEPGVYRFATSDPAAVLSYWGDLNYPSNTTDQLPDYEDNSFTRSVNSTALGQSLVVGISGAPDCILIITREGDAVEDIPYTDYEMKTPPEAFTISAAEGAALKRVDLTAATDAYQLVLGSDGYYHLGSASGPVMYVQLTFNNVNADSPVEPPYIHLYKMVGGVDNTGTALRCIHTDAEGNEIREDYTEGMLAYGACADPTYGVYPLTEDLMYMIRMGGQHQGWWDAENAKGNLLFKDEEGNLNTTINLENGWMFACCYIPE